MKTKHTIIALALLGLVLQGCKEEDRKYMEIDFPRLSVDATIQDMEARVGNTVWDEGRIIGVSIDGTEGFSNCYNIAYKYSSDNKFAPTASSIFLRDKSQTLTAYYPYAGKERETPEPIHGNTIEANQKQENQAGVDFMFATAAVESSDARADFVFTHKMSKLILNFKTEDGSSGEIALTLGGLRHEGAFDVLTGEAKLSEGVDNKKRFKIS